MVVIDSAITPTDVKVYMEDGTPYLDYTGMCYARDGSKIKVHLPKISLTLSRIEQEKTQEKYNYFGHTQRVTTAFNVCVLSDKWAEFKVLEREVSKKQLEKELGYKLNIKE